MTSRCYIIGNKSCKDVCIVCGKYLHYGHKTEYCQEHLLEYNKQEKIKNWLESGKTGFTVDTTIRGAIRNYILEEQNHLCAICGQKDVWNNQELHFILDHIDGDASNSCRKNLRLICPNCDSQLDTFKSRNKNSARNARKEFLKENTSKQLS